MGSDLLKYLCMCSDLDHTLLMPDSTLSQETKEILTKYMKKGFIVVPATGRAFHSIPEDVLNFPGLQYAIVSNGAAIYDIKKKKPVYQLTLEKDFPEKLLKLLSGHSFAYECFIEGQAYTSTAYFNDPSEFGIISDREKNYVQSTRVAVDDIHAFILEHADELDALDVLLPPEQRAEIIELIRGHFSDIYITTSVPHLIEISHSNSGKHQAMKALSEIIGIPMERMIAFGDGDNDSEMLREAGLGVAVANASKMCLAAADEVAGASDMNGVVRKLEQIMSGK